MAAAVGTLGIGDLAPCNVLSRVAVGAGVVAGLWLGIAGAGDA